MIGAGDLLAEIERYASFRERDDEDIILPDIYNLPGITRSRAEAILAKLVNSGILVEWGPVWTRSHRQTTAYRLAEGKTTEDVKAAIIA